MLTTRPRHSYRISLAALIAVALTLCVCSSPAVHAAVTVEITLTQNVLRINETSRMQVTVRSDGNDALNAPVIPEINGLTFSYRATSNKTNWSMVNGRTSVERAAIHEYDVIALASGQYSLKDIRVQTESGFVAAKPVTLSVLDQSAPAPTATPQPAPTVDNQQWPYYLGQINKQDAYVGEEVILDYYLLVPRDYERSIQIDKVVDKQGVFQSFWVEKHEIGRDLEKEYVKIDNEIFAKFTINRYILYPLKPGKIEIGPLEVQGRRAVSMGISVFRRQENFSKSSNAITLNVKPLPEEGKPQSFKGAVGRFQLNNKVDEVEIDEGDPVTLSISLEGFGNLRNAPSPQLPDLSNFDQFDPTTSQDIQVTQEGVSGRVDYTHVLIPHDINANEIGPVQYAYFDPQTETYITLETPPIELKIHAALGSRNGYSSGSPRRIPTRIGDDFRFIHTSMLALASINLGAHRRIMVWLFALLPLALLGATLYAKARRDYLIANPDAAKRLRAPLAARKCLSDAQEALAAGDLQQTYAAIGRAIIQTIDHCWNLAAAGLTINELKETLIAKGVDADSVAQTEAILETVDGARFSGGSLDAASAGADLKQTEQIVQSLMKLK